MAHTLPDFKALQDEQWAYLESRKRQERQMARIEYLYREGEPACSKEPLKVRMDGRIVGEIRKVEGGYQYFPNGSKTGGDVFKSVAEVQRSLIEE